MAPNLGDSIRYQLAHISETRGPGILALEIALMVFVTLVVILRLVCRRLIKVRLGADDITIIIALLLSYLLSACSIIATNYGLGRHLFAIDLADIETNTFITFLYSLDYAILLPTIKLSIIFLYIRIFPIRSVRLICYGFIAFLALWSLTALIVTISICRPISFFWNKTDPNGKCINFYAFVLAEAILTIVTDVVLLIIPIPLVWGLRVERRQRIAMICMFLLGGFVCITSIIRIPTLPSLFTDDPTWTSYNLSQWSILEADFSIVCACLPTLRPLVRHFLPERVRSALRSATSGLSGKHDGLNSTGASLTWPETGNTTNVSSTDGNDRRQSVPFRDPPTAHPTPSKCNSAEKQAWQPTGSTTKTTASSPTSPDWSGRPATLNTGTGSSSGGGGDAIARPTLANFVDGDYAIVGIALAADVRHSRKWDVENQRLRLHSRATFPAQAIPAQTPPGRWTLTIKRRESLQ